MEYRFKNNWERPAGVSAETVAQELETIRAIYGTLTTELVVREAQDPRNPLHGAFEWDDTEAARQFRLKQAASLIRAIVVIAPGSEPRSVFVNVRTNEVSEYDTLDAVVQHPDRYAIALSAARTALESAQDRLMELHEAARTAAKSTTEIEGAAADLRKAREQVGKLAEVVS